MLKKLAERDWFINVFIGIDGSTKDYHTLFISIASALKTNHKEYYMYDFTAIVSSLGGGIGIFLGYSCFGVISSALQNIYQHYQKS